MGGVALGVAECAGIARTPGARSASPSTALTFFQVGNVACMRWARPRRGCGIEFDRLGPPLQFRGRHDDLGVREDLRVGVLGHQAEDVIAVEMRDHDGLHVFRMEPAAAMLCASEAGLRAAGLSAPVPESISTSRSPRFDRHDGERDRHMRVGEPAGLERGLGLLDVGALDEVLVVRLLPDAVVERDHLDVADLVLLETRARRRLCACAAPMKAIGLSRPNAA